MKNLPIKNHSYKELLIAFKAWLDILGYAETTVYNPHELKNEPEGSVFVFYCDTGKATFDRLKEYKEKFQKEATKEQLDKFNALFSFRNLVLFILLYKKK